MSLPTPDRRRSAPWPAWITLGFLIVVFSAGAAWAAVVGKLDGKLDAGRFVTDSISRDARANDVLGKLGDVTRELNETNSRLREMACGGRPGCR